MQIPTNISDKKTISLILFVSLIALVLQLCIPKEHTSHTHTKIFTNPLYAEFVAIAKQHNLDLSFTKNVWFQRGPIDYKQNTIFAQKPNSIDILFLGDSSIAWGVIPQVLEQITGKKIAIYAYESNLLTQKTAKLFNKISSYYLKKDGIVIFSFDDWTQKQNLNDVRYSKKTFQEMLQWNKQDFAKYATSHEPSFFQKYLSYDTYTTLYNKSSEYLKTNYHLELKSPSIYANYIEKYTNPTLYQAKAINQQQEDTFIRWDMHTTTLYNPQRNLQSIASSKHPKKPLKNKNIAINAKAASQIYGSTKIYMVPIYAKHSLYLSSRNIYQSYYKDLGFELCDLGQLHPKDHTFSMQEYSHMANTGGLQKSILIANYLKAYLQANTSQE